MTRKQIQRATTGFALLALGASLALSAAAEEKASPAAPVLRHAVSCPPFQGDPALASIYHGEMVKMLKSTPGIEYLEGPRALARRAPEFNYHVNGSIVTNEDGQFFVMVTLSDEARNERIASHVAPASADPEAVLAWKRTIQADMARRATKLPFECRVRRKAGQESVSLDRGLDAGLEPGMVLYVSAEEEPLISPVSGEIVGRDSPRAFGQIQIFRVMEDTAYARPVLDTKLPLFSRLYARSF
jgi:hypothetical protein